MSDSKLVTYTLISPNCHHPRNHKIDTITIHHMAGNLSVEQCGKIFQNTKREASSNYGIGTDGRIGLYVHEEDRAWTSGSPANDHRAITFEVANDGGAPDWHVSDKALESLINLLVDICKRNGIEKLVWSDNKDDRVHHRNGCNMTVHRDFQATACVPTFSEVLTKEGWVKLSDIQIGDEIACADLDNLRITFEEVYDKVPVRYQDTYTNHDLTATKDHRMVHRIQRRNTWLIDYYAELLSDVETNQHYIPIAGFANFDGLPISNDMLRFLIAVQADAHYMYETRKDGSKGYYGVEFHLKKERKIKRIKETLESLHLDYRESNKSDGTVSIRVYNDEEVNIVNDICEQYLHEKKFTWKWLEMSPEQAAFFLEEILFWDGCAAGKKYTSHVPENLDIVNAIAAINGVGSKVLGSDVLFRDTPYIVLSGKTTRHNKQHQSKYCEVSCVSVKTGVFLMRQNGKTFIVGNCPGPYLYSKQGWIAQQVNERLEDDEMLSYEQFKEYMKKYEEESGKERAAKPADAWAVPHIEWANEHGIMVGDDDGNFRPQDPIKRQEMAGVARSIVKAIGESLDKFAE